MLNTPFSPWPSFTEQEVEAVSRVLRSNRVNYWTGEEGRSFEREFAEWAGTDHAVAMANGTLAIDAAWPALGIGEGDEVICTPRTYCASASSIAMAGARPIFADVDLDSQNITPETVEPLITKQTRAIMCVHLAGWPCDMEGFVDLARKHDMALVEDCAQAHGAAISGRPVGSFGNIGSWSFCQDKIITTGGEGGMVTTSDEALWKKIWSYKDHGKSWDAVYKREHAPGFRWLHESLGSNFRLTEMQAAIGRIQLARMPEWHAARKSNAGRLTSAFREIDGLRNPEVPAEMEHAWYKFYAFIEPEALKDGWSRDRIMNAVTAAGVPCYSGSCPEVYREKVFIEAGMAPPQRLPNALALGETSLMFLVHPTLTEAEIARTCDVVASVMKGAVR
ncbi:DegT/DnrJ/EryC1/StrS aminotransferase family protein [Mesorhizobium sp. SP-1A]|uniref:DegT/DnrJ/EryC1/StrS family aminotransferase n=1 Tax=Mesorhizobium sp. SP-1A TaxID=3077840 RepID=UPI0028F6FD17|nr:DegT/DnrJ/EryC1/StrS aminotransferase family protein [Mesorhizobium sp. SP-1A]